MPKRTALVAALIIGVVMLGGAFTLGSVQATSGSLLASVQEAFFSVVRVASSCKLDGATVASGSSRVFYLAPSVPTGETCESIQAIRKCSDGNLSESSSYSYASCSVKSGLDTVRTNLTKFLPYVWATTWYPWFNNQIGTDPEDRGLELFRKHIAKIKEQGLNTVWIGGNATWNQLQPTPGVWDISALDALKAHLKVLQDNNMRAIFQLNYIGLGYASKGIDGCTWMNDPAQVEKFSRFVGELGGQLAPYNYMIYYMVFTEQAQNCLLARGQADIYKGIRLLPDGKSETIDIEEQSASHAQDAQEVTQMLKNSIGKVTKTIPSAIRKQMYIGIHDALLPDGQITETPADMPSDFDYFSIAYYPSYPELAAFPTDAAIGAGGTSTTAGQAAYKKVLANLDAAKAKVVAFHPNTPLLLGEFGWPSWDADTQRPLLKKDAPARNLATLAMLDWSITRKIGFNLWGWLPQYLDTPEKNDAYNESLSLVVRDAQMQTNSPTLTTVNTVLRQKLKGEAPPATACSWNGTTVASGSAVTAYQAATVPDGQTCVSQTRTCTSGTLSGSYTHASCAVVPLTTLSASCSASGGQGTFSWAEAPGATAYYLNVYDTNTKKYVKGPNASATSPVTLSTTPGNTYTSWVYVVTSSGWSKPIGGTPVTCNAPDPVPEPPTPVAPEYSPESEGAPI